MFKASVILISLVISIQTSALTIKAVGDTMLQSSGSHLPQDYFHNINYELSSADITFGNYEGTICETSEKSWKCKEGKTCYAFKSDPSVIDQLLNVGFDVVSIANNHIYDYGEYCANQTQKNLEQAGILAVGLMPTKKSKDETSTRVRDINGTKVGIVAFHYSNGWGRLISIKEYERATKLIKAVKEKVDIVVVSFHGGDEGKNALYVALDYESHYRSGENRGNLRKFSKLAVDAGADLILGHGPHVPRGMELYKNKLIAYSLSNFATPWGFSLKNPMNLGLILEVNLNERTGDFESGKIIPTKQSKRPAKIVIDTGLEAVTLIKKLTNENFDSPLGISSDGELFIKGN